ncbi:unnamed protein product [Eruca vesicaria subsp. sativa]|uniref:TIR domain-containing protein n=1 Tax=Eruca vesicaria subsp. sativa TaxID=29727 RepID=A0ABC8K1Y0_ERUVS|nr:unnamed protein product [Eruca vesicaria subsp. sativa]
MPPVFINFRGKDERQKLLPHLKHHLKDSNVNVFTDDDAIGEPLKNLFKHIRRSRIVIVIFSVNYLESGWCLDELVEIRKCLETEKIDFAIPIFYKVKTSHVKEQNGKFGKKFVALQKKHRSSRIIKWKKALRYVAKLIGLTYQKRSSISELDFIRKIVKMVDLTLTKISSKDGDNNKNSPETSKGVASRPLLSPNFAPFVQVPTCYRLLEPNVPQDYRRTFSYHNNIYQYPPWPHATGLNLYPTRLPPRGSVFSLCRNNALSGVLASLFPSNFDQGPTIDPTSMHDEIVSTSHDAETEDITSLLEKLELERRR